MSGFHHLSPRVACVLLLLASACSEASAPTMEATRPDVAEASAAAPVEASDQQAAAPAQSAAPSKAGPAASAEISRILGKKDITMRGEPSCKIDFVYPGFEPEDILWDGEPCEAVTAQMMDRGALEKLGKWDRLDAFAQQHVAAMPGGKVVYVEGAFTASVYPVGTTRMSYEVSVAD